MSQQLHIAKGPCPIPGCECQYPKKDGTICDYANVVRLEAQNVRLRDALAKIAEVCNGYSGEAGWACKHAHAALMRELLADDGRAALAK